MGYWAGYKAVTDAIVALLEGIDGIESVIFAHKYKRGAVKYPLALLVPIRDEITQLGANSTEHWLHLLVWCVTRDTTDAGLESVKELAGDVYDTLLAGNRDLGGDGTPSCTDIQCEGMDDGFDAGKGLYLNWTRAYFRVRTVRSP